ncbi:cytidine deaminase [Clostridia bacterium]|nr:cytidine deaminase [Clostridia bacterium]
MTREIEKMLLLKAKDTLKYAYAKYSKVRVAAALLAEDGSVYTGVNVENASFGLTVCAERNAIFNAVGEGRQNFKAMAIVSDSEYINSPCGSCRQVMTEFSPEMEIVLDSPAGLFRYTAAQLLPGAFSMKEREE